jgi:hypothetical protein
VNKYINLFEGKVNEHVMSSMLKFGLGDMFKKVDTQAEARGIVRNGV